MVEYKSWSQVPSYLKTKMKLEKLGLQPKYTPDAMIRVFDRHGYKRYYLYDIEKCIPMKNYRTPVDCSSVDRIEMNTENLAEALYVINKFAKRIRDQKNSNYEIGQYESAKNSKLKEQELYHLKEKVLNKLLREEKARILGVHRQTFYDKFDCELERHLLLIVVGDYDFHRPTKGKDINKYPYLGDIDIISAKKKRVTKLSFTESLVLLEKYLQT